MSVDQKAFQTALQDERLSPFLAILICILFTQRLYAGTDRRFPDFKPA